MSKDLDHGFMARHCARHSVTDLARTMQQVNDAIVGTSGALAVEAFLALAADMVAETTDGDEQIDRLCAAIAEAAKRRRRGIEVIKP